MSWHFQKNLYQCSQCVDPFVSVYFGIFYYQYVHYCALIVRITIFHSPFYAQLVSEDAKFIGLNQLKSLLFAEAEFSYLSCTSEEGVTGKFLQRGLWSGFCYEISFYQARSSCISP